MIDVIWLSDWTERHNIRCVYDFPFWTLSTSGREGIRVYAPYYRTWHTMATWLASSEFKHYTKIVSSVTEALGETAMTELFSLNEPLAE